MTASSTRPMRDLAESMIRFSWAAGLLGASHLTGLAWPSRRVPREGLDAVTWTTRAQLGEMLQAAFQAGDDLGSDWLDLMADAVTPGRLRHAASRVVGRSKDALRFASLGSSGAAVRQELKNKFEVYQLVKGARKVLDGPPRGQVFEVRPYVERAYRLDAYRALWAVEGLGHDYAEAALEHSESPRGLLQGDAASGLPADSLAMLHGGLGLALAEHLLTGLSPESSPAAAREVVERFAQLCRANSTEEHLDTALEALGLETRCFFPDLVPVVESGLAELDDELPIRFFWHGVGRAIYFLPVSFVPGYGSLWQALRLARREAPYETARHNAQAGVAYAFTMVNMAHPAILEQALRDQGEELRGTAFADGVIAAVVMRQEITPGAPELETFIDHTPAADIAELWNAVVRRPCRGALGRDATGGDWRDEQVADVYRSIPKREAE